MTPQRIHRKRVKGWRMPPNTKSVCRPGRWGNPFTFGDEEFHPARTREEAIAMFRRNAEQPYVKERIIKELRGFNLACYCPLDKPCHADVLLEIANS